MPKKVCGTCNFQIDSKVRQNRIEILCAYYNEWHADAHTCRFWQPFSSRLLVSDRI